MIDKPFTLARNPFLQLSPSNTHALVPVAGPNGADYWIADFGRSTLARLTVDGSNSALWSPDSKRILWTAPDGSRYLRAADGSGQDELLFKSPGPGRGYLEAWSNDGKQVAFALTEGPLVRIWLVALDGDRKPFPYLKSSSEQFWPQFSPDSRWMAYVSDETGQPEVFVESVPSGRGRRQVSTEGGDWPIWRADGKELFYRQGARIMSVAMRLTAASVESETAQPLFDVSYETRFQVSRDGQRFLIAVPLDGMTAWRQLTVDTDWRANLPQ